MHGQQNINLCSTAVNFDEGNMFRPLRSSRNANFQVWSRSQGRYCTSTYPWNNVWLAECCAMRYRFNCHPPDRKKKDKYLISTNVTARQTWRNEPDLNIYGINTGLVLTKWNWSTQTIWGGRNCILKKRHKACECSAAIQLSLCECTAAVHCHYANVLLLFTVITAGILTLRTGINHEKS